MTPTVFRWKGYRFFFFSREETRMHVHVYCADGEAKLWMQPEISVAENYGLRQAQLAQLKKVVEDQRDVIVKAWNDHFSR